MSCRFFRTDECTLIGIGDATLLDGKVCATMHEAGNLHIHVVRMRTFIIFVAWGQLLQCMLGESVWMILIRPQTFQSLSSFPMRTKLCYVIKFLDNFVFFVICEMWKHPRMRFAPVKPSAYCTGVPFLSTHSYSYSPPRRYAHDLRHHSWLHSTAWYYPLQMIFEPCCAVSISLNSLPKRCLLYYIGNLLDCCTSTYTM